MFPVGGTDRQLHEDWWESGLLYHALLSTSLPTFTLLRQQRCPGSMLKNFSDTIVCFG